MALSRLTYNSLNVTPTASKGIGFDSGADDLAATFSGGDMTFISKFTSDGSDTTATFASGIDSTYKEYLFIFNDIHPETDGAHFQVNFRDGSTAYDATKTTSFFYAYNDEGGGTPSLAYVASEDLAQSTSSQRLTSGQGNANDESASGYLHLFNPSSTTFVTHFIARTQYADSSGTTTSVNAFVAGYCNVTAAIDGVQFAMSSDEIQAGTISLYGIK